MLKPSEYKTLGDLKKSGYLSRSVKDELRENLKQHIKNGTSVFDGIKGYDKTVIPQIEHSILAKHDIILLGLRGQAKTRILRSLNKLLDPYIPIIAGSDLRENPFNPITNEMKKHILINGDNTAIEWINWEERYSEKLATPDTTVADLIGDVDPIKAATLKKNLSDEQVINYGLIPKANRGLFAINELPDLQPRIQVALLNIMQERDIQIRGFNIRIPLDIMIVFSANPEDYTSRGNIITPLKDRIDAQIITHYPKDMDTAIAITDQEVGAKRDNIDIHIPYFIREVIECIAIEARKSEYIDQKSGVSARLSITALEHVLSSAERRSCLNNNETISIRLCDIYNTVPALTGKLELVYEGEQEGIINVARHLIGKAIHTVFKKYFPDPRNKKLNNDLYSPLLNWFSKGNSIEISDTMPYKEYSKMLSRVEGLEAIVEKTTKAETLDQKIVMMEFVLEALHQNSILGKVDIDNHTTYSDMVGTMLGSIGKYHSSEDEIKDI